MSRSVFRHSFIPFHLADPAGVLFFGHAFTLTHQVFEQFVMHGLGQPWSFWFKNPDWFVPIKHAEANYLVPLRAGEICHIELSIASLSSSSFTLASSLHQHHLACIVKTAHVFCSHQTRRKIPIPASLLPTLQTFLNDSGAQEDIAP